MDALEVQVMRLDTERPESDATLEWNATVMVLARVRAEGIEGLGWTYGAAAVGRLIVDELAERVLGADALRPAHTWTRLRDRLRNVGAKGPGAMALSAVDVALWDLAARLLERPVADLLGAVRDAVPGYGSGGFTSEAPDDVAAQLGGWADEGYGAVKMKVGRRPAEDAGRIAAAREAVGPDVTLMVDANGAFTVEEAVREAHRWAEHDVRWFEEPVRAEDREGLRTVRARTPAGMQVTAGEYAWTVAEVRDLIGCVDVMQVDATRIGGFTAFLRAAALCEAHHLPLSSHTAPTLHLPVMCAAPTALHVECFHDHVRLERRFFDGAVPVRDGLLRLDRSRPGLGVTPDEDALRAHRIEVLAA